MFRPYSLVVCACLLAAFAGFHTPVFGHGTTPTQAPLGTDTVLADLPVADIPDPGPFVNYETPHVHPLDISPDGTQLAVVNTPDGQVEIFNINASTGNLAHSESIRVGLGPVTARWRSNSELWVVNQLSDSISVIDMVASVVTRTIVTFGVQLVGATTPNGDEPADVVFADFGGNPYAFVSCSRTDIIQTYDLTGADAPNDLFGLRDEVYLLGEDPRSLATDGSNIYAAIFESGNSTTLIFGESDGVSSLAMPPNTAAINSNNHLDHPYSIDNTIATNELLNGSLRSINPAPSGLVGPFTSGDSLGAYTAHGKSIDVVNLPATTPPTPAPTTSIIVRKDFADGDKWKDDNGADWTRYISGDRAGESGRVSGWDMLDNDVAILDLGGALADTYATRQMNICMALNISPSNGNVYMVGIDATNEVRFEPNITGTFVRVMLSITNTSGTQVALIDLNETHLDAAQAGGVAYEDGSVPQADRDDSIGDPRGVAFTPDGATLYITGMGSDNVIAINTATNERYSTGHTIEVGQGPTGAAHHPTKDRLYVVNKFGSSVSVINTATAGAESLVQTKTFHDPTPAFVNTGRVHFYGTHENSGLGQLACASCHIDGRMDRLAWDLGNPAAITDMMNVFPTPADSFFADIKGFGDGLIFAPATGTNPNDAINTLVFPGAGVEESEFPKFHPMKGPMTTQTLQDIIGKEPHHWRGDKDGIEEFAGAFDGLQGDDAPLNPTNMQQFEDFLSTINFPPNPFRPVDNTMPGGPTADGGTNPNLDMTGFFAAPPPFNGNLSAPGTPMETAVPSGGDAWAGYTLYVDDTADGNFRCVDCHTLPIGAGSTEFMNGISQPFSDFRAIPAGANGEAHQMVVNLDGTGQKHIKIPQTRNQFDKDGFFLNQLVGGGGAPMVSRAGFGVLHDGSVDGIVRFLSEPAFSDINNVGAGSDQNVADIVSFTLALGGADFTYLATLLGAPTGSVPPAANDQSAHAGVGESITISTAPAGSSDEENTIYAMSRRANEGVLGLIVVGKKSGERRGWSHSSGTDASALFQSDRDGETIGMTALLALASSDGEHMTFTTVDPLEEERRGLDRDQDTVYDGDESLYNTDTANPDDHKWVNKNFGGISDGTPSNPFKSFNAAVADAVASAGKTKGIHLRVGTYNEGSTYNSPMLLIAEGGTVTLNP